MSGRGEYKVKAHIEFLGKETNTKEVMFRNSGAGLEINYYVLTAIVIIVLIALIVILSKKKIFKKTRRTPDK